MPDALGLGGNGRTQLGKQPPLDFDNLLLRIQNLRLVFLQLRRGETLGIDQRLLAFVISGSEVKIGFRYFQVIAENRIKFYFERSNARPLTFPLLDLRQVLLTIAAEVAQFVQLFIHPALDYSTIAE